MRELQANDPCVTGSKQSALLNADGRSHQERHSKIESGRGEAIQIEPDSAEVHCNLAGILVGEGRLAEAEAGFRKAIRLKPDLAKAHCNLGVVLTNQGRLAEAESSFREAIRHNPGLMVAYNNLGNILRDQGRFTEAEASCREAIRLNPDFAEAYSNLGNVLRDLERFVESGASCREAIRIKPDFAEAHNNLGNALTDQGRLADAEASYREAIRLKPDYAEAHSNLGGGLLSQGRLAEAEASCREAIRLKSDFIFAYNNLGNALQDQGLFAEAEVIYREAVQLNPDFAEAHNNLGNALTDQGRLADAETSYREAIRLKPGYAEAHSNLLFSLNYIEALPPSASLSEAKRFGALVTRKADSKYSTWLAAPNPTKLRIGFVSGDFRNHPVGYFFEGLLSNIDKSRFELFAYSTTPEEDALTERIKPLFDGWVAVFGKLDRDVARIIHQGGPNILVDLAGHTADNRLPVFAYKAAPVQASWLGYFATTGVSEIDYLIADPWTLPEQEEQYFSEEIWRLPETRLCFSPPIPSPDPSPLPALSNHYITFGCFSNLAKLNDSVVMLWARVLSAVPNSRLFIKAKQLDDRVIRQYVIKRFATQGIGSDRLTLEGPASRAEYLSSYRRIDIVLDTFPFPGGTTTVEALWMGVPVLTLAGKRFVARQGVGILMNAGLPEWIATDPDNYVEQAVFHASDPDRLAALRMGLRQKVQNSPAFDAPRFARHFEAALWGMWHRWQKQHGIVA